MANYIVNGNDLTLVANSIRSKGNTNETLVWPTGFKNAIDNISVDVKDICIKTTDFDDVVKVDDAAALGARDVVAKIEPVQDLHGYDSPWPGGGRKNKANPAEAQNNKWIDETTGQITDTNGYWVTGFIPVKYGDMVRCTTKGTIRNAWYNSDKSQATYAIYGGGNEGLFAPFDGFIVMAVASGTIAYGGDFMVTINDEDLTYSPYSNICPITGWTGAEVYRRGKNLLNAESPDYTDTLIGTDGSININQNYNSWRLSAVGTFTLSIIVTERINNGRVVILNSDNNVSAAIAIPLVIGLQYVTFSLSFGQYALICIRKSATDYQLELGSTATDYEPYQGDTFSVTFPSEAGTVYGGTVDLTKGKLVVDMAMKDLGTLNYNRVSGADDTFVFTSGGAAGKKTGIANIISDFFLTTTITSWTNSKPNNSICGSATSTTIVIRADSYENVNDLKAALDGHHAVYELATPITYDLTPQEIAMFKGTNILSSTTGKTQLKYFTEAFEPLAAEIGFVNGGDY